MNRRNYVNRLWQLKIISNKTNDRNNWRNKIDYTFFEVTFLFSVFKFWIKSNFRSWTANSLLIKCPPLPSECLEYHYNLLCEPQRAREPNPSQKTQEKERLYRVLATIVLYLSRRNNLSAQSKTVVFFFFQHNNRWGPVQTKTKNDYEISGAALLSKGYSRAWNPTLRAHRRECNYTMIMLTGN